MTSESAAGRPRLEALAIGDDPERWSALGFLVTRPGCWIGATWLALGVAGDGIVGWRWAGLGAGEAGAPDLDGLASATSAPIPPAPDPHTRVHPNGALSIDHVVVVTGGFDRTAAALAAAGLQLRRVRRAPARSGHPDAGCQRQGFYRVGEPILELVEVSAHRGPPHIWGLVVCVEDLDRLADSLGGRLGRMRPAVQPGRRIATLTPAGGLGLATAFISPEPGA